MRRTLATVLTALVLAGSSLAATGCGAASHLVGGILARHLATHLIGNRNANRLFCVYHGHRVIVDLRTGHRFFAALNAVEAYRDCKAGFLHR